MTPLLLVAAGLVALGAAVVTLRSFGPRYRVGRLLAATPTVTVAEARELAASGDAAYVRIAGRIDAEEPFEDADHRPLVLRRTRLESRDGSALDGLRGLARGRPVRDQRGPRRDRRRRRRAVATASSSSARVGGRRRRPRAIGRPAGLPPTTPVRAVIEQVSVGRARRRRRRPGRGRGADGAPTMTAGLGRPLILTTLETDEAMRILAGGVGRPRFVAACVARRRRADRRRARVGRRRRSLTGFVAAVGDVLVPVALAADPTPGRAAATRAAAARARASSASPCSRSSSVAAIAIVSIVVTTI